MGLISEPRYDGDYITLAYLNKVINESQETIDLRGYSKNFGVQPIPPYHVNDTYMNGEDIYICISTRLIGDYNSSDWELASAYTDDTLASTKCKVFNTTPTTPYNIGDLWTGGVNGELRRCITQRLTGDYTAGDWENATKYDSTSTIVEGGLVTTGTIQVVQGGTVPAGITGNTSGDTSVRFWAGSTLANRTAAPFRVTQAGAVTASNATITGNITASSGKIAEYTISGAQLIGTNVGLSGVSGQGYAFWAGSDNSSAAPFRVGHDGSVYASNVNLTGAIAATSGSFTGTINSSAINSNYLDITSGGYFKYYKSPAFLVCGNYTSHPYVSVLNVATQASDAGGISFRTGTEYNDAGSEGGRLSLNTYVSPDRLELWSAGTLLLDASSSVNIESTASAVGIDAETYIALRANDPSTAYYGTNQGSIYVAASDNINLKCGGYVYVRGNSYSTTTYKVVGDTTGPSSKNLKKNIVAFSKQKYKDAIDILKSMKIYDYDYKYKLFDHEHSYGFIIDEIEKDNKYKDFFLFKDEQAIINDDGGLDHSMEQNNKKNKILKYKKYDLETLTKYLLVISKAQQEQIDSLEEEINILKGGR